MLSTEISFRIKTNGRNSFSWKIVKPPPSPHALLSKVQHFCQVTSVRGESLNGMCKLFNARALLGGHSWPWPENRLVLFKYKTADPFIDTGSKCKKRVETLWRKRFFTRCLVEDIEGVSSEVKARCAAAFFPKLLGHTDQVPLPGEWLR